MKGATIMLFPPKALKPACCPGSPFGRVVGFSREICLCLSVSLSVYREIDLDLEIEFEELVQAAVEAGESTICRVSWQPGDPGKSGR